MLVRVVVRAGERRERVREDARGKLEVTLKEPAANNLANSRLVEILAAHFGVSTKAVRIVRGLRSGRKSVRIDERRKASEMRG